MGCRGDVATDFEWIGADERLGPGLRISVLALASRLPGRRSIRAVHACASGVRRCNRNHERCARHAISNEHRLGQAAARDVVGDASGGRGCSTRAASEARFAFSEDAGRPGDAFDCISRALRLSPNDPSVFLWIPTLAASHYLAGRYDEAIEAAHQGLTLRPDYLHPLRYLVAALGQLGQPDEAAQWLGQLRGLDKNRADTAAFLGIYYDPAPLRHILDGLEKAGFD